MPAAGAKPFYGKVGISPRNSWFNSTAGQAPAGGARAARKAGACGGGTAPGRCAARRVAVHGAGPVPARFARAAFTRALSAHRCQRAPMSCCLVCLQRRRDFCASCGPQILFWTSCAPGSVQVSTGALNEPARHPPQGPMHGERASPWLSLAGLLLATHDGRGCQRAAGNPALRTRLVTTGRDVAVNSGRTGPLHRSGRERTPPKHNLNATTRQTQHKR